MCQPTIWSKIATLKGRVKSRLSWLHHTVFLIPLGFRKIGKKTHTYLLSLEHSWQLLNFVHLKIILKSLEIVSTKVPVSEKYCWRRFQTPLGYICITCFKFKKHKTHFPPPWPLHTLVLIRVKTPPHHPSMRRNLWSCSSPLLLAICTSVLKWGDHPSNASCLHQLVHSHVALETVPYHRNNALYSVFAIL